MSVEILGTESFEELEAKLLQLESEEDGEVIDDHATTSTTQPEATIIATETKTGDTAQQVTTVNTPEVAPQDTTAGQVTQKPTPGTVDEPAVKPTILARDGVHTIPYDVLEATRERARQAEERAQQLSDQAAKAGQLEKELNDLKQRAVDAGVDESILDGAGLNSDQMKELMEEYPALGRHLQSLTQQISALTTTREVAAPVSAAPVGNVVDIALLQTPELDAWRTGDQDRWEMALKIDGQLQKDPDFAGKSLVQRFQEVQSRVKAAFGDTPAQDPTAIAAQAEKTVAAAAASLPGSPSDVGSTAAEQPTSKAAQIAAQSGNALLHSMAGMSDAEIDALLSTLDY